MSWLAWVGLLQPIFLILGGLMTTHDSSTAPHVQLRAPLRLRRELVWALVIKLVVLFSLKAAFFPQRLPADEAARGVADQMASSAPSHETVLKDKK